MFGAESQNPDFVIVDLLSRHENGYDVMDTMPLSVLPDITDEKVELISSIEGENLDPLFLVLAGAARISSVIATANQYTHRHYQ